MSAVESANDVVANLDWAWRVPCEVCRGYWWYDDNGEPIAATHSSECPRRDDSPPPVDKTAEKPT